MGGRLWRICVNERHLKFARRRARSCQEHEPSLFTSKFNGKFCGEYKLSLSPSVYHSLLLSARLQRDEPHQ